MIVLFYYDLVNHFVYSMVLYLLAMRASMKFVHPKASITLFTLPSDTLNSISNLVAVIHWSFQMSSSARWSNVQPLQYTSMSSAWPFSEHVNHETQQLKVPLSTPPNSTFFNHFWMFITDSFSATRNSI